MSAHLHCNADTGGAGTVANPEQPTRALLAAATVRRAIEKDNRKQQAKREEAARRRARKDAPYARHWFPKLLRDLRAEAGLTQSQVADRSRINWRTIIDLEQGVVLPRMETAEKLLAVFNHELEVVQS